jgi:HEAT repeat protein
MAGGDSSYFTEGMPSIGAIERRRRIVRDFLCAAHNSDNATTTYYSFEAILDQIGLRELQWTLVELLNDEDMDVRLSAALMLLEMGHELCKAEQTLLDELGANDAKTRFGTAIRLSTATRVPDSVYSALLTLFKSKNWFCRVAAAAVLGDHTPETLTVLTQALRGGDPAVVADAIADWTRGEVITDRAELEDARSYMTEMLRDIAATALGRRGIRCREAVDALVQGLERGTSDVKFRNICLLLRMGPQARDALPALSKLLEKRQTDGNLRQAAAGAIAHIAGSTAAVKALVRPMLRALKSGDWALACVIVSHLSRLASSGELPRAAIIAMARQLGNADPMARAMAASSLGKFGAAAAEFIPSLLDRARTEQVYDVRKSMIEALVSIGPPSISFLVEAFVEQDVRLTPLVGECLARLGAAAADQLASVMLSHPNAFVRSTVANYLRLLGPDAAPAVPVARRLLKEGDEQSRYDGAKALGAIGPAAASAAPELVEALLDPNPDISSCAADALVTIGPLAIATLEERLREADEIGQEKLRTVLGRIQPAAMTALLKPREPEGIEVMRDEALLIIEGLEYFETIGHYCRDRGVSVFSFKTMVAKVITSETEGTLKNRINEVSEFFHRYFEVFEGSPLLGDTNPNGDANRKIFDRQARVRPAICDPWGWRAWRLTCQFLERQRQEREAALRRANRKNT